jgi:hypothetical protein
MDENGFKKKGRTRRWFWQEQVRVDPEFLKLHVAYLPRQEPELVARYVEFFEARQSTDIGGYETKHIFPFKKVANQMKVFVIMKKDNNIRRLRTVSFFRVKSSGGREVNLVPLR